MAEVTSSQEALTNEKETNRVSLEIDGYDTKKEEETATPRGFNKLTVFVEKVQISFGNELQKRRKYLHQLYYTVFHVLLIGYFAWATYFFFDKSEETLNSSTCTGYGFLMILMIFIYIGIFYYVIFKPYILPTITRLFWSSFSARLDDVFSITAVKLTFYLLILVAILAYLVYDSWDHMERLQPLIGLAVFLIFGFVFSKHPSQINWHTVVWGLLLQFFFGLITIRWEVGRNIFDCLGNKTTTFLNYATEGAAFVYGDLLIHELAIFGFKALSTIYFLGFMVNILYHYGIMQKVVATLGEFLQAVMGTTICESVNSAANIFLGMTEAPLLLKPYLENLTTSEIHSVMTSGFATVSGTVLAAYISFGANASHLITASVMSAPAALCYSKLMFPETEKVLSTKETICLVKSQYSSVLDAASKGASVALEVVLGIIANLIAFIAFVAFLNGVVSWMGEQVGYTDTHIWTVEKLMSYFFMPVSYIMGVPWKECGDVGRLIGIKTIINEFAAFKEFGQMADLSPRTKVIATYAICGFSNPSSIGITISTYSVLMPSKRHVLTSYVFRAFIGGAIVCFMTACVAGLLISDDILNR